MEYKLLIIRGSQNSSCEKFLIGHKLPLFLSVFFLTNTCLKTCYLFNLFENLYISNTDDLKRCSLDHPMYFQPLILQCRSWDKQRRGVEFCVLQSSSKHLRWNVVQFCTLKLVDGQFYFRHINYLWGANCYNLKQCGAFISWKDSCRKSMVPFS